MTAAKLGVAPIVALLALCLAPPGAFAADRLQHELRLIIDPGSGDITVSDRIAIAGRRTLQLRLAPWLRIVELRIDGHARPSRRAGDALSLTLPDPGRHRIDLIAEGVVPPLETRGRRRASSGAIRSKDWLYLPAWSNWVPHLEKATASYRLTIETPATHRAVATGRMESENLGPERNASVFSWPAAPEPPSVFAGPYRVAEKRSKGIRLRTYFDAPNAPLAEAYLAAAGRYLEHFSAEIGPYPFADFHIVSARLPVGLGFRNLTYVDRRILRLPFMRGRSLAHEVLHNWWGNGVFTDYASGNWSEGLTTYMADHDLAARRDPLEAAAMRLAWLRDYAALPASRDMPASRFVSKRHDASQVVGYGKVAFIFHMLKQEVGAEAFGRAIRRLWQRHKFRAAGWTEIRTAFEAVTGKDLAWYFGQWVERAGAPRLTLAKARAVHRDGGHGLEVTLAQSEPRYRLNVPVEITTAKGTTRTHIRLQGERGTATFPLDAAPTIVKIDPDHSLFRRLLPGEAPPILRDVLLDRGARTIVLEHDAAFRDPAQVLATRLFGAPPAPLAADVSKLPKAALLVVGTPKSISGLLARFGLPARPAEIAGRGSARAWTARRKGGKAILFVEAVDADALTALLRPLPHYRSRSFVVFEGRRAIARGVWPVTGGPLVERLE